MKKSRLHSPHPDRHQAPPRLHHQLVRVAPRHRRATRRPRPRRTRRRRARAGAGLWARDHDRGGIGFPEPLHAERLVGGYAGAFGHDRGDQSQGVAAQRGFAGQAPERAAHHFHLVRRLVPRVVSAALQQPVDSGMFRLLFVLFVCFFFLFSFFFFLSSSFSFLFPS